MVTACLLLLAACGGQEANTTPEPAPAQNPTTADNSRTNLDWASTYSGIVPSADSEGIATSLTLEPSGEYSMKTQYLGKSTEVYTTTGVLEWEADGNRIRLKGVDGAVARYHVGEGQLFQLDQQGERITGELAANYILRKEASANTWPLLDTYWKLVEVMGKPVAHPEGRMPAHMVLSAEDDRVAGNSGCNSFFSTYELDEAATGIRFQQAGSTMMACPDMSVEDAFNKALLQVDNYSLADGKLSLNKARMAPLLRFEAVEM